MKKYLLLFGITALIVAIFAGCEANTKPISTTNPPENSDDLGQLALQVPLEDTAAQRDAFVNELKITPATQLKSLYEKWIDIIGANGIIDTVQKVQPLCHDIEHDLGKVIYARVGNVGDALRTCNDSCSSGCMHGVLMEFFQKKVTAQDDHVDLDDVKSKISSICGSKVNPGNPAMYSIYKQGDCAHGVGHALMFLSNYDIPKAISYCKLFDTPQMAYYCATGAYMEYVTTHDAQDTKNQKDVFYPCDQVEYPSACFRYKMAHVVPRLYDQGTTLEQMQQACLNLKGKYQLGCFHGLGNGHYPFAANGMVTVAKLCSSGDHDDQYVCIEGLIERLARYLPDIAKNQCSTLSGWQNDLCKQDVGHALYDLKKAFNLYLN